VKKLRAKQETYDKIVKELHPVKASPKKNQDLAMLMAKLKHPVRQRKDYKDNFLPEFKSQLKSNRSLSISQNQHSQMTTPSVHKHKDYLKEILDKQRVY